MSARDESDPASRRYELENRNAQLRTQIDSMLSDLRRRTADLQEKQAAAAERTFEVVSDDGMVTARVDSTGALKELELSPKAFERSSPDRLAHNITSVVREATGEARRTLQADFTADVPDLSEMVPGLPSVRDFLNTDAPVPPPDPAAERAKRTEAEPARKPERRADDDYDDPPDSFMVGDSR